MHILDILKERGFIAQVTFEDELYKQLEEPTTFYVGFDPTADSLHIGHYIPIMAMAHMQRAGHKPIALMGGGTAMIGDPSGKTDMRKMMTTVHKVGDAIVQFTKGAPDEVLKSCEYYLDNGNIVKMTQVTMDETAEIAMEGADILEMRALAAQVPVIDEVLDYAVRLVSGTHPELENAPETTKKYVKYGASPRAAQALITCAKVRALMNGNFNVSYADVEALALPVLRHRIKINYTAINDKLTVDGVIAKLIGEIKK